MNLFSKIKDFIVGKFAPKKKITAKPTKKTKKARRCCEYE
jgi:hypothetical protein